MTTSPPSLAKEIPIDQIKPFISRARGEEGFRGLKDSIKQNGVLQPIQVRDLGRKGPDGKRYVLICGEGRTTACQQLGLATIPAIIEELPDIEIAGRFLAENMMRKPQPWAQKGKMIRELMGGGEELGVVAKRLSISEAHARKYLSILSKGVEEVEEMPVNDAEKLVTMPARDQKIIMEVVRQSQQSVAAVVEKAKAVKQKAGEGWTKAALQKALSGIDDKIKKKRRTVQLKRLHHALGPKNIQTLLRIPAFVREAEKLKLNLSYFQK